MTVFCSSTIRVPFPRSTNLLKSFFGVVPSAPIIIGMTFLLLLLLSLLLLLNSLKLVKSIVSTVSEKIQKSNPASHLFVNKMAETVFPALRNQKRDKQKKARHN